MFHYKCKLFSTKSSVNIRISSFIIEFCLYQGQKKGYYTVICGEHELNSKESHQVELKVTSVITHPKWVTASQGYDIAVYKVRIYMKIVNMAKDMFYIYTLFL